MKRREGGGDTQERGGRKKWGEEHKDRGGRTVKQDRDKVCSVTFMLTRKSASHCLGGNKSVCLLYFRQSRVPLTSDLGMCEHTLM